MKPNPESEGVWRDLSAPPVEQALLQEHLGAFPGQFTDQGEAMATPETRSTAKQFREGKR